MQQVIYVDVLVFLNTVITFIILLSTVEITGITAKTGRVVTASFIGGIYSLIIFAPTLNIPFMLLTRAAMSVSLVSIAFNLKNIKKLLKCICSFLLVSFLYAGIIYAAQYFFQPTFMQVNNGYAYYDFSLMSLIIVTVAAFIALKIVKKKFFTKKCSEMIYDVDIVIDGKTVSTKALLDSGNDACDAYTGNPVIIVDFSVISEAVPESKSAVFKNFSGSLDLLSANDMNIRILPVKTISGTQLLPTFTADSAVISDDILNKTVEKPSIAVACEALDKKEYKALISDSVFEVNI